MNTVADQQIEPVAGHWYIDRFLGLPHTVDFVDRSFDPPVLVKMTVHFTDKLRHTCIMELSVWRAFTDHEIDNMEEV